MKQLISVRSESQTTFGRFVSFITALVQVLVNLNALTAGSGDAVIEFLNDPQTVAIVNAIGVIIIASLPSILGWRNKKKELPSGVTVGDVTVKSTAVDAAVKERKIVDAARATSVFVFALMGFAMLTTFTACSSSCPVPVSGVVVTDNRQPIYSPVPTPIPMPPPTIQLDK